MQDLNEDIRDVIDELFIKSAQAQDAGDMVLAVQLAEQAWKQLPEPKFEWDVSKSFAHSVAETYRDAKLFDKALAVMQTLLILALLKIIKMALDLYWLQFITIKVILMRQKNGLLLRIKYQKVVVLKKNRKSILNFINQSSF